MKKVLLLSLFPLFLSAMEENNIPAKRARLVREKHIDVTSITNYHPIEFESSDIILTDEKKDSDEKLNNFMQEILAAPDGKTRIEITNNHADDFEKILAKASTPQEAEAIKSTYEGLQRDDNETLEKVRTIWGK